MWPYLALGSFVGVAAVTNGSQRRFVPFAILFFIVLTVFIGLRHHVGMDWNNYLIMIDHAKQVESYADLRRLCEPLYGLMLIWGGWTGYGIYIVNFVGTIIFLIGLFVFIRQTPEPWLGLMASMPILVMVVAMSANRQAIAAGILMLLVAKWYEWSLMRRTAMIIFACGFHASALIFLAFVGLDLRVRLWIKAFGVALFVPVVLFFVQQSDRFAYYDKAYGSGRANTIEASGAIFHVAINSIPALVYFLLPRYRSLFFPDRLLRFMAFAAMVSLPLVVIFPNAAGRTSLYWFPVSIWFWACLPQIFSEPVRPLIRLVVCCLMVGLMYFWLAFGNAAFAHIPYQNALLVPPWRLQIDTLP